MKQILLFSLVLPLTLVAQTKGRVGINTTTPKATLDISKTSVIPNNKPQGVIFPRVTTEERNKFVDTKVGTLIYNTDKSCVEMYIVNILGGSNPNDRWTCLKDGFTALSGSSSTAPGGIVSDSEKLITETIYPTWDIIYDGATVPIMVSSSVPNGTPYPKYTSPQVTFQSADGTKQISLSYPSGTVDGNTIIATLHVSGDGRYLPPIIKNTSEEYTRTIPLKFNNVLQDQPLTFEAKINAVENTEHGSTFVYPIFKVQDKYFTQMNLGADYAKLANTNPAVLYDWAQNFEQVDLGVDSKAFGSLFQWQRKADGHELMDWESYTTRSDRLGWEISHVKGKPLAVTTINKATSWDAPDNKFILDDNVNNSTGRWVTEMAILFTTDYNLWQAGGANNPCPTGWHVPTESEFRIATDNEYGLKKLRLTAVQGHLQKGTFNLSGNLTGVLYETVESAEQYFSYYLSDSVANEGSYGTTLGWGKVFNGSYGAEIYYRSGYNAGNINAHSLRCVKD